MTREAMMSDEQIVTIAEVRAAFGKGLMDSILMTLR